MFEKHQSRQCHRHNQKGPRAEPCPAPFPTRAAQLGAGGSLPKSLGPIESENNEPASVSVSNPDNQRRVKKKKKRNRRKKEKRVRPNCFLQGERNLIWRRTPWQGGCGAPCNTGSVRLLAAAELLLAFLARRCHGPVFL